MKNFSVERTDKILSLIAEDLRKSLYSHYSDYLKLSDKVSVKIRRNVHVAIIRRFRNSPQMYLKIILKYQIVK